MRQLSPAGEQAVNDIARRHGFSHHAVATMLDAVMNGNGGMAQFSHPEFGGSGQWMRGGMTMIGDMFNNNLKGRVDALCGDLSVLIASEPGLIRSGSFQSQTQGEQHQTGFAAGQRQAGDGGNASLFVPAERGGASGEWWPAGLGWPNSTGAQNNVRYAYFAQSHRLAIEVHGMVTVYDTLDHQIGGFSQQQSYGGTLSFSSQHGSVDVSALPVVSGGDAAPVAVTSSFTAPTFQSEIPSGTNADILTTIEKLADLRGRGILSDEEFAAKKAELLARL